MVCRELLSLWLLFLPASIPPLDDEQRTALQTAYDGRDHREAAFVALVDNALEFAGTGEAVAGSSPVTLRPDLDAMLAAPDASRGVLCRIDGVLQQATRLPRPHAAVMEWFVRDAAGRPILVYVAGLAPEDAARFVDGRTIHIYARFYKRVDAVSRDGVRRAYPAFVGARPWTTTTTSSGAGTGPIVLAIGAVLVVGLVVVFVLLSLVTRRTRVGGAMRRGVETTADVDDGAPLPDDPAAALVELRRRAEEGP